MAIELGQASKPTRKQRQQQRVLERSRRKAQNRANRTGEPVPFGNETTRGMVSPQAAAPKPRANRAARKALTPVQRKQKRMAALKAKQAPASNAVPTPGKTLLGPSQIQKRKPSDTYKPFKSVQRESVQREPDIGKTTQPLKPFGFSKGGVSTNKKSNFGTTDYRKTGMTTHTSVRSNKK